MIPLKLKPEPENFDKDVRQPGMAFLKETPKPSEKQFKNHSHWRKAITYMHNVYNGICAYSALYINNAHGASSVDHFIPKTIKPKLAYEWSNFRYSSRTFNLRKGLHAVLDPFKIGPGWFWMNFPSLLIIPNPELPDEIKKSVKHTIEIFKWNEDEKYINICKRYIKRYCAGQCTFNLLEEEAPFIASELKRQEKIEEIKAIMDFSKDKDEG